MSAVEKVEQTVRGFSRDELTEFARWFDEFRAGEWDKQMERDATAGKLDKFAREAIDDLKAGRCTPVP